MSVVNDQTSLVAFDATDHQTSYIFKPVLNNGDEDLRPKKRRKLANGDLEPGVARDEISFQFPALLNGAESPACIALRQSLFKESWVDQDSRIQSILEDSNESTLAEVASFIKESVPAEQDKIPTGLIVTGPNIASQEWLFTQLASHLRLNTNAIVVTLRSGDAPNLKTVLKKLIRDATSQRGEIDEEYQTSTRQEGRKLLNYDLQILQNYLKSSTSQQVVVAFQDSEAFDSGLLSELVALFSSWLDRIPFVTLFGIATSVELFHERFPRASTRSLQGAKFDVEQVSKTLDRVFQKVVAGAQVSLRLGPGFIKSLLDRQQDHVQSLQAFISAVKYAYMCHFYANPLSILLVPSKNIEETLQILQPEHFEAIRMLPSFQKLVENHLSEGDIQKAKDLLVSDEQLRATIISTSYTQDDFIISHLRRIRILSTAVSITKSLSTSQTSMYTEAFSGTLGSSDTLRSLFESVKRLTGTEVLTLVQSLITLVTEGHPESDLEGWAGNGTELLDALSNIMIRSSALVNSAEVAGIRLQSRYAMQHKSLRTTVIAQKVQLSKEESILSKDDVAFTGLVDELCRLLRDVFIFESPQDQFLHEIWLYDSKSPNREVFTPRPRHAIERALGAPHDYLGCSCCKSSTEGLSSSQPPSAILYQLYLETGGLINVFDLWSAFSTILGGDEGQDSNERTALVLFYRALADLRFLGMIKQSRKKTDHLAKLAWKNL